MDFQIKRWCSLVTPSRNAINPGMVSKKVRPRFDHQAWMPVYLKANPSHKDGAMVMPRYRIFLEVIFTGREGYMISSM
jgi:hypothetical protein